MEVRTRNLNSTSEICTGSLPLLFSCRFAIFDHKYTNISSLVCENSACNSITYITDYSTTVNITCNTWGACMNGNVYARSIVQFFSLTCNESTDCYSMNIYLAGTLNASIQANGSTSLSNAHLFLDDVQVFKLLCSAYQSCSDTRIYGYTVHNFTIECAVGYSCENSYIYCPTNYSCVVNCSFAAQSCFGADIFIADDAYGNLELDCGSTDNTCSSNNGSTPLEIHCLDNGFSTAWTWNGTHWGCNGNNCWYVCVLMFGI